MNFKNIFNRLKMNKQIKKTPRETLEKISWSEVIKECYDKDLNFSYPVTKVIYSDDKTHRAVILQKPDMLFTTIFQKLYVFDDEELKYVNNRGYWSGDNSRNSIFNSEKEAENSIFSESPFKYNKH